MNSYDKEAIFHLPGCFEYFKVYKAFFQVLGQHPDAIRENCKIGSLYGSPSCKWNGGRAMLNLTLKMEDLKLLKAAAADWKIPIRFTFTNCLLTEEHLDDVYANILLAVFANSNNEIICNSEILEKYIRNKYKDGFRYISSTTKRLISPEAQNKELEKDYYLVVLDYDYNFDFDYLKSIENKEKCELLCNPVCVPKCPYRKEHYKKLSALQLDPDPANITHFCPYQRDTKTFFEIVNKENVIKPQDINKYLKLGFKHFKLEGRATSPLNVLDIITHYLIKDEHQNLIKSLVHGIIW